MACFSINTKIFFGKEQLHDLHNYLRSLHLEKLLFVVDENISSSNIFTKMTTAFYKEGFLIKKIEAVKVSEEPTYDKVDQFTAKLKGLDSDAIIAVGGGSILDLAKGIGILLKNTGRAVEYRGRDRVKNEGVPVICVPTTAGTGAEVTHTASLIDVKSKTKLGINGRYVSPLCGVLLPEFTFSCPEKVTISSGLDAMLHAIEAVSARTANKITSMLGAKAFALLYNNFKKVLEESNNYDAREAMLVGSYYAGIAMMNAGGGPASGISYPLGVHYGINHGIAGGIFLPHVFEYNVSKGYKGYVEAYNNLPDADLTLNDDEKSLDFVNKINKLYHDIGVSETLNSNGWNNINVDSLTELTMKQKRENLDLNPIPFGKTEVRDLINKIVKE